MNFKQYRSIAALLVLTSLGLALPSVSYAAGHRFRENEWRGGRWVHDRHSGRLGWWWVVGPSWYFYDRPYIHTHAPRTVIIEQAPPVTVVQAAPPAAEAPVTIAQAAPQTPVIYYCKATGTNYPETMTCPGGWSTMTATTPPQP